MASPAEPVDDESRMLTRQSGLLQRPRQQHAQLQPLGLRWLSATNLRRDAHQMPCAAAASEQVGSGVQPRSIVSQRIQAVERHPFVDALSFLEQRDERCPLDSAQPLPTILDQRIQFQGINTVILRPDTPVNPAAQHRLGSTLAPRFVLMVRPQPVTDSLRNSPHHQV